MNKIYNSPDEWYHPEIDYYEMLEKFRWTRDPMMERDKDLQGIWGYEFPLRHVDMFHFVLDVRAGHTLQDKFPSFQWWNKQLNDGLAKLLSSSKLVLEVGAGDGMLSSILSKRGVNIQATDSFHWSWENSFFEVEKLSYVQALRKYNPDAVICSWMPLGTNWTPYFRKTESVQHYITIGEVEAACGGEWKKRKGWTMREVDECSKFALCRTDDINFQGNKLDFSLFHSEVHLFSRKNGGE